MEAGQSDSGNAGARPGAACAVLGCDCLQRALHAAGMAERTSHVSSPRAAGPLSPRVQKPEMVRDLAKVTGPGQVWFPLRPCFSPRPARLSEPSSLSRRSHVQGAAPTWVTGTAGERSGTPRACGTAGLSGEQRGAPWGSPWWDRGADRIWGGRGSGDVCVGWSRQSSWEEQP